MTKEEKYQLIENYLAGGKIPDEENWLLRFGDEIKLHKGLQEAIADADLRLFEERIKEGEAIYFAKQSRKKRRLFLGGLSLAAALAFLFAINMLLPGRPSGAELYGEYFTPYQAPSVFRSEKLSGLDEDLMLGLAAYKRGSYGPAIGHFSDFLTQHPDIEVAYLLRGVCYLNLDSTDRAQQDFEVLRKDGESLFVEQANWYLALSLVREERWEEARELLEKLSQKPEAGQLLRRLP